VVDNEGLLPEADVQWKAQNFLLTKYPESKITFSGTQLVTKEDTLIFQLSGVIIVRTRGSFDRFLFRFNPSQYSFDIELDARQGAILHYQLR